jgi:hypothetical protein
MARAKFNTIKPKPLHLNKFRDAYAEAAKEIVAGIKKDFADATMFFREPPVWRGYTKLSRSEIYISVGTTSLAFKYYDQGNGGPSRIIYPKQKSVLHWIDKKTGEDVFVKWVRGYEGRKVSDTITQWWNDLMPEIYGKYLAIAIEESGHKPTGRSQ